MSETNRVIYEMMLQTPLGKSLSDADRGFLEHELSIKPVAQIDGWIGDQIRKAAQSMVKGDYVGHPFRGNQHSNSSGAGATGGAGAQPKGAKGLKGVKVGDTVTLTANMGGSTPFDYYGEIVAKTPDMITILTEDSQSRDTKGVAREVDILNLNVVAVDGQMGGDSGLDGDGKSMNDDLDALEAGFKAEDQAKADAKSKAEARVQAKADAKAKEIKVKPTDPLDAKGKKEFVAGMKFAGKAMMQAIEMSNNATKKMQELLKDPKVRANREKVAAMRDAMDALQEANAYMDEFNASYELAAQHKGTMKGAYLAQSGMVNAGELWKGAMRTVYENAGFASGQSKYNAGSAKDGPFGSDVGNEGILQDAGDKNFGLPFNVDYNYLADQVGNG
jgi:hypothetical protein